MGYLDRFFFILIIGLVLLFVYQPENLDSRHAELEDQMQSEAIAPFKTTAWWEAFDEQQGIKASSTSLGKFLKKLTDKPGSWNTNPLKAFFLSETGVKDIQFFNYKAFEVAQNTSKKAYNEAIQFQGFARSSNFENLEMNRKAEQAIEAWRFAKEKEGKIAKKINSKPFNKLPWLLGLMLVLALLFGLGKQIMGDSFLKFAKGFLYVFAIAIISYLLAAQANMKALGFGYAAWAIIIGLLISNTIGTPNYVKPALATEFFIKTGLVLLGAEILFGKILAIGLPGIFVAWVVTPIVLITTYWFGQKILKISSKTLNMTISADMSVCGVSAAVATAAACKASKEELTLAIGLSMIFTSVMMIVLPAFINWVGMPEVLGGAWIGGTIDATGAVVAAGAFLGDDALNVAATIKMIQNVLIGIIAFGVAIYFATKVEKKGKAKVGWGEIWRRFPKFILGFIGASILFSIIYEGLGDAKAYTMIDQGVIRGYSKNMRGWLFCLAFVSIGLSTNFKELKKHFTGGKPLILYLCGQTLNLLLTLLMAYIMFYKVFPHITANI